MFLQIARGKEIKEKGDEKQVTSFSVPLPVPMFRDRPPGWVLEEGKEPRAGYKEGKSRRVLVKLNMQGTMYLMVNLLWSIQVLRTYLSGCILEYATVTLDFFLSLESQEKKSVQEGKMTMINKSRQRSAGEMQSRRPMNGREMNRNSRFYGSRRLRGVCGAKISLHLCSA